MMAFCLFACALTVLLAGALTALTVTTDRAAARAETARAVRLRQRYAADNASADVIALPARLAPVEPIDSGHRKAA